MFLVKEGNEVLVVSGNDVPSNDMADFIAMIKQRVGDSGKLQIASLSDLNKEHVIEGFRMVGKSYGESTFDVVIAIFKQFFTNEDFLAEALRILRPNGLLVIREPLPNRKPGTHLYSDRISSLKLSGFKVKDTDPKDFDLESTNLLLKVYSDIKEVGTVSASKPSFEVGSSIPLSFAKKATNVWKLDDPVEEDLIDEDELLDESDLVKPDASSLTVCATTGKRKACKDCSCGLAEELSGKDAPENNVKSSCGSCYLGDAFRCASCPYLGMPAFKPGEKVLLPETQLTDDS
ncbi:anamorsin homolog [Temnothorax nylanderi]|uniref:anamorsin homolog n=1 Tax=Temnothorax nylanderi TaxID=102681 RepID=UPI003A846CAD